MQDDPRFERIRLLRNTLIVLLVLGGLGTHLALRLRKHPHDFDSTRHTVVAEVVVQEPTEDDYYEHRTVAVWFDPTIGRFYSIYDPWVDDDLAVVNRRKLLLNYAMAVGIGLLVAIAHWRMVRLGMKPSTSANPYYRRREELLAAPPVFAALSLAVAVLAAAVFNQMLQARSSRSVVVGAMIHDHVLHEEFLSEDTEAVRHWSIDLIRSGLIPDEPATIPGPK